MVLRGLGATTTPLSFLSVQPLLHIKLPRSSTPTSSMTLSSPLRHSYSLPSSSTAKLHPTIRLSPPPPRFRCNNSSSPGSPLPGENESKTILDAFFLGKAFAEALNERIESTVGELLGTVGRLQAEQQKQVQEFQEEVMERGKRAKEKAAREAIEEQVLFSGTASKKSSPVTGGTSSSTPLSAHDSATPTVSSSTANVDGRTYDLEEDNSDEVLPSGLSTTD